jgi:hypothetical protein
MRPANLPNSHSYDPRLNFGELALQREAFCARRSTARFAMLESNALQGFSFEAAAVSSKGVTYAAGPAFQWNILNYGQITNNVRLQDAKLQQLLVDYQNTVLKAQQQVDDCISAFLQSRAQVGFLRRSAEGARRPENWDRTVRTRGYRFYDRADCRAESVSGGERCGDSVGECRARCDRHLSRAWGRMANAKTVIS